MWADPDKTVAQWARWFVDNTPPNQADGTLVTYDDFVRSHIDGTPLGALRLRDVREAHIWEWLNTRRNRRTGAKLTGWTPYNYLRMLKTILNGAARNGLFGKGVLSPTKDVNIDPPQMNITVLSPEQIDLLLDALPPWLRGPVLTQAELGLRTSELLGLRDCDVNLTGRPVDGVPSMTAVIDWQRDPRTRELIRPKNGGRRPAPISTHLAGELRAHMRRYPPDPLDGYLFCAPSDGWGRARRGSMHQATYARRFRETVRKVRAAHPEFPQTGRIVPHGLRHHYSSQSLADGVPEAAVAAIIGHRGTATLRKVYEHAMPQYLDQARQARERARAARISGPERDSAELRGAIPAIRRSAARRPGVAR
jgi:integrase